MSLVLGSMSVRAVGRPENRAQAGRSKRGWAQWQGNNMAACLGTCTGTSTTHASML